MMKCGIAGQKKFAEYSQITCQIPFTKIKAFCNMDTIVKSMKRGINYVTKPNGVRIKRIEETLSQ